MNLKILRLRQVVERTGANITTIYAGMKNGTFPKSVLIGKRSVGWLEHEVVEWIERRIAARDKATDAALRCRGGPGRGHGKAAA